MRFRKRLGAVILAAAMMVSSAQMPGGISNAAQISGSSTEDAQEVLVPAVTDDSEAKVSPQTAEETEDTEEKAGEGQNRPDDGTVADGGSQSDGQDSAAGDDGQTGSAAGDDTSAGGQTGDDTPGGSQNGSDMPDSGQTGDDTPADGVQAGTDTPDDDRKGDDTPAGSQTGEDSPGTDQAGDDTPADSQTEGATADGQVSGNDLEESVLTAETVEDSDETETAEVWISGAYQFGDVPGQMKKGRASADPAAAYDAGMEDYLYQQLLKRTETISIADYKISTSDDSAIDNLVTSVVNEHPDLYFVKTKYTWASYGDYFTSLTFEYDNDYDDKAFADSAAAALSCVEEGMSDYAKVIALHDWLAINVEYDYDRLEAGTVPAVSHNAYGALVNGKAVCQGYALAYKYLLNQVGIESFMVTTADHQWNMVKLDGAYYHVDVTFDDPVRDLVGRVKHSNLLCSDANLEGHDSSWKVTAGASVVDYKAESTKYANAFWKDSNAPLILSGNDCYYIDGSGSLRKADIRNIATPGTRLKEIGNSWEYGNINSGLFMVNDRLYYNTSAAICSVKTDGTDQRTEFTAEAKEGYQIYGSAYSGGKVLYAWRTGPNLEHTGEVLTAEIGGGTGGPDGKTYNISYVGVVDYDTANAENPKTYVSGTEVSLKNPYSRAGYRFDGWYKDGQYTEKVTKIPADSTGDITLYAKWVKGAFGLANLTQSYKTLADASVSSAADKKPKLLLFFNYASDDYLSDINSEAGTAGSALSGVDLYAVEVGKTAKNVLSQKYGSYNSAFTFCYDTGTGNLDSLNAYADAAGIALDTIGGNLVDSNFPVICYIDKDNRLQYVDVGESSVQSVLDNLRIYCQYPTAAYTIEYVLDGGTNDSGNPKYYDGKTAVTLKAATRTDYVFDGWYTDAACTQKVTEIAQGTTGDITLYAKWKKTAADITDTTNFDYTFTTLDGQKVSSKADGRPKVLYFISTGATNCQQTHKELSEHIKAFEGVDIYAVSNEDKDTVTAFKDKYGCDGVTYCCKDASDSPANNWKAQYYATRKSGSNSTKSNLIVFIDAEDKIRYIYNDHAATTWTALFTYLQDYCGYNRYYVNYELNDGIHNSENPFSYQGGTAPIALKAPTKGKDRFEGWYLDAAFTQRVTAITEENRGNLTLYAKWTKLSQGLNTTNLDDTFTGIDGGTVSTKADGKPKLVYLFFTDCPMSQKTTKDISDHIRFFAGVDITAVAVKKGPSTEAPTQETTTAYKDTYGCDEMAYGYYAYNEPLYSYAEKAGIASKDIYTPLIALIDAENRLQHVTCGTRAWSAVFEDLQIYCDYDCYLVNYELDGGTNDSANPELYTSTQETVTLKDASRPGYVFEGWYRDAAFTQQVTQITKGSKGNLTLYAKWGRSASGLGLDNLEQNYAGLDEQILSSKADGKPKLLVFVYYNESGSQETVKGITDTIGSQDGVDIYVIECYGTNKANVTTFKNTYGCDGMTFSYDKRSVGGINANKPGLYMKAAGMPVKEAYGTVKPADGAEAYPILCYIDKDNKLQWVTTTKQTGTQVLENLKNYCGYQSSEQPPQEGTYKITYELNGGKNSKDNPDTYTSETDTIVLKDASKEGAVFDGWYKDAKFLEKVTEIAKGSTGDIKLYAKWRVKGYDLPNLDQTYTALDGTKLSSKADGKPKVLIFYFDNNNASKNTLKSVSGSIGDFSGADIYAIECNKDKKDKVSQFMKQYGCDGIPFAYDEAGDVNKPGMSAYTAAIGMPSGTTVKLPIICYIDENNKYQLLTQGESSAEDVLKNLQDYCGYVSQEGVFKITYVLDGGTNDSGNPNVYTADMETITLKDAAKKGFVFDGWYKDAEFKEKVTQIAKGSTGDITLYAKWVPQDGNDTEIEITFAEKSFVYNGREQKPKVTVTAKAKGEGGKDILLKEGTDYTLSYKNNKNAGTATVSVTGTGEYTGTVEKNFVIEPAPLTVRAVDLVILVGDSIPAEYGYEVDGLRGKDELIQEPVLTCAIADTTKEGEYPVIPSGADAGSNYVITYENGLLTVTTEYILWKVTFDTQGHGKAPAAYTGVRSGSTVDSPAEPRAEGYRFDGWYRDSACTKPWDFGTDTVQSDLTLYAKWLTVSSDGVFAVQEIADVTYNGKAQKPAISVYDEDTLLKAGRDYTIKYYNNTNANAVKKGETFNENLPYAAITGKGNYKETVKINFNILRASLNDGKGNPAAGVVLKVNDHLAKTDKAQKAFGSIKKGKTLKQNTDYELVLRPVYAFNAAGSLLVAGQTLDRAEVPGGCTGEFQLTVRGKGNYTGSIYRTVYVADKNHLMKNVKITLGKKLKNADYTGSKIRVKPTENPRPGDDEFVVTCGGKALRPNVDYYAFTENDGSVGKAEIVVVGISPYFGRKTAAFTIKGKPFNNGTVTVEGLKDNEAYTGRAVVQNKNAVLTWKTGGKKLVYGKDYTISYSKNVNRGTATITFTGMAEAGYSGTVKKTFKIGAADIADQEQVKRDSSMRAIAVPYAKGGAKPVEEIILTGPTGKRLRNGKDYTLKYKDNKAVTANATVTVTGKGNYSGSFDVSFAVKPVDLSEDRVVVLPAAVAYNPGKADSFAYQPAVRIKDGKASLTAGKDYNIEYLKNTQADYKNYLAKLKAGTATEEDMPRVSITAKEGSNYCLRSDLRAMEVELQIYQTKFSKRDLSVQLVGDAVYTGGQVRPEVTVSYQGKTLRAGVDYMLVYGANNKAGRNKGSVTVTGLAPEYGGSVTYKFEINRKDLKY